MEGKVYVTLSQVTEYFGEGQGRELLKESIKLILNYCGRKQARVIETTFVVKPNSPCRYSRNSSFPIPSATPLSPSYLFLNSHSL
jgi:hypothetical protein